MRGTLAGCVNWASGCCSDYAGRSAWGTCCRGMWVCNHTKQPADLHGGGHTAEFFILIFLQGTGLPCFGVAYLRQPYSA